MSVDKMQIDEMTFRTFKVNIINQNLSGANCHRTKQAELEKLFRGSTDLTEVELKLLSHVIENTDDVKKIRLYCFTYLDVARARSSSSSSDSSSGRHQ
jgi:hypothetical protein